MRLLQVMIVGTLVTVTFALRVVFAQFMGRRSQFPRLLGKCIADFSERFGGAYLKAGQILSTRVDLLPEGTASELARLRDQARPIPFATLASEIAFLTDARTGHPPIKLSSTPLASATIAQVHVGNVAGVIQSVAVKVRRPGIEPLLKSDIRHIRIATRLIAKFPGFDGFPLPKQRKKLPLRCCGSRTFAGKPRCFNGSKFCFRTIQTSRFQKCSLNDQPMI